MGQHLPQKSAWNKGKIIGHKLALKSRPVAATKTVMAADPAL